MENLLNIYFDNPGPWTQPIVFVQISYRCVMRLELFHSFSSLLFFFCVEKTKIFQFSYCLRLAWFIFIAILLASISYKFLFHFIHRVLYTVAYEKLNTSRSPGGVAPHVQSGKKFRLMNINGLYPLSIQRTVGE